VYYHHFSLLWQHCIAA